MTEFARGAASTTRRAVSRNIVHTGSSGGWRRGWREDERIWEVRGELRHFTHSKVMAWVAFDRGVRFCEECGHTGQVEHWRQIRDEIHAEVLARGFSERKQAFTQAFDSEELDASLLQMPLVGFLPGN